MITDDRSFPDHDSRSMVDAKVFTYFCTRVYINTGPTMRVFGDYSRNTLHAQVMNLMSNTVRRDGIEARVCTDHLAPALCCRITFVHRRNIVFKLVADGWKRVKNPLCYYGRISCSPCRIMT